MRSYCILLFFLHSIFPAIGQESVSEQELSDLGRELDQIQAEMDRDESKGSISEASQIVEPVEPALDLSPIMPAVSPPNESPELIDEISEIRAELLAIQRELNEMGWTSSPPIPQKTEPLVQVQAAELPTVEPTFVQTDEPSGMGFYLLPFLGVSRTESLQWKSFGGDFELQQDQGHSLGLRTGYSWNILFLDFQLSHYENEIEQLDLSGLLFDLTGKTEGVAYHASIGAKMYVTPKLFLSLGGGLGGSDQSISFELMTITQEDDEFLLSYQVFAGLEYFPVDHFRIGLRYRWTKMEEMNLFSSQELHLCELSVGYSH